MNSFWPLGFKALAGFGARRAAVLFFLGATVGSLFDGFHTWSDTTVYKSPVFAKMAWWTPPVFGLAVLLTALGHHISQRLFSSYRREKLTLLRLWVRIFAFTTVYYTSGFSTSSTLEKAWVLGIAFLVIWFLNGRNPYSLVLAILTGVSGSLAEIFLTGIGEFSYRAPDFCGIPYWLPFLYCNVSETVADISAALQTQNVKV